MTLASSRLPELVLVDASRIGTATSWPSDIGVTVEASIEIKRMK